AVWSTRQDYHVRTAGPRRARLTQHPPPAPSILELSNRVGGCEWYTSAGWRVRGGRDLDDRYRDDRDRAAVVRPGVDGLAGADGCRARGGFRRHVGARAVGRRGGHPARPAPDDVGLGFRPRRASTADSGTVLGRRAVLPAAPGGRVRR